MNFYELDRVRTPSMNLRLILSFLRPNLFYKIDSRSKNEEEEENEQNERKDKKVFHQNGHNTFDWKRRQQR